VKEAALIEILNRIAPPHLALPEDNIGLQVGDPKRRISKILLALDLTQDILEKAILEKVDLVITHHPLIFAELKSLTTETSSGRKLRQLIAKNIDLFVMHTNFDIAPGGLNDALADLLELQDRQPLKATYSEKLFKLVVFVPQSHEEQVRLAILDSGAGKIGNYSHCSFRTAGTGTFKPLEGTKPFIGKMGRIEEVAELRIETVVEERQLPKVLEAMLAVHPYEEVAYDIYPLARKGRSFGLGRFGILKEAKKVGELVEDLKKKLGLKDFVKIFGSQEKKVTKVGICSGSGGDLIEEALKKNLELFITGEVKHHQSLEAMENGLILADLGHYHLERIFGHHLRKLLQAELAKREELEILAL